jgi:hypothetical protein
MTARLKLTTLEGNQDQVSGVSVGFDIFTPLANLNYYLVVTGKDVANGAGATLGFVDTLSLCAVGVWAPAGVVQTNTLGAPGARTYTNVAGKLHVAMAGGGVTYYVDILAVRFSF